MVTLSSLSTMSEQDIIAYRKLKEDELKTALNLTADLDTDFISSENSEISALATTISVITQQAATAFEGTAEENAAAQKQILKSLGKKIRENPTAVDLQSESLLDDVLEDAATTLKPNMSTEERTAFNAMKVKRKAIMNRFHAKN